MEYKNHTINIETDQSPENPLTNWDHGALVITLNDGRFTTYYNTDKRDDYRPLTPDLTKDQARQLIPDLMREDGYTSIRQWLADGYYSPGNWSSITDWLNDEYIPEWISNAGSNSDTLNRYETIYQALGLQVVNTSVTGYSQSDYAEVLVVADEDYYKMTGCNPDDDQIASLQSVADTYGAWAWGDVYGYTIIKSKECPHCQHDEPEEVDSCWGFYGDDHEKSGLLDMARNAIDCIKD